MKTPLLSFVLLVGLAPQPADIVHLRGGGKIEGLVTDKGDKIEVKTADGTITVEKERVERIEKKEFKPILPAKKKVKLGSSYAHPFYAFKIQLPLHWTRGKDHGSASASFWGPKEQFYQPRMDLHIQTTKKDLPDFVTAYKDALRKSAKDVQFLFEEATAVRETHIYRFCVSFTDGDIPIVQQALFTFFSEGERKYILAFNCSQAWFDRYYGGVDASMRSLRIYPMPQASKEQRKEFLLRYNSGETRFREGKFSEALADFQEAAKIIPEFADLHSTIAAIHMRQAAFPDAEAAYRKAIAIDSEDANHSYNLGVCLLKQSKVDGAIESLKRSLLLDPEAEPALTNLGVAYLGRGLNDLARQTLEKAVQAAPESAPAHYNLALALERLDRKKEAGREYKEALSSDPDHADARKGLERTK